MNVEQILEATPLLSGSLRNRREELKSNLVILTLSDFNEGEKVSADDIQLKLRARHNIDLKEAAIRDILHDLQSRYVKSINNGEYEVLEIEPFDSIEDRILNCWPEYKQILIGHIDEIDPYVERRFKSAFLEFFKQYIIKLSKSVEKLGESQKESLLTDWENTEKSCNRISESENINKRGIFRNSIKQYLQEPGENLIDIVESCYTTAVNVDLLSREEVVEFPDLPEKNRKLIVDTNILVALLAKTDSQHEIVEIVCERTDEIGFDIRYTKETQKELESLIEGCKNEMSGLYSGDGEIELANNQFVKDFSRQQNRDWSNYASYLENWREHVAADYDVKLLEEDRKPDSEIKEECQEMFLESNSYDVSSHKFNNIQIDAKNLGIVASYRKHSNWDFGPFLLSFHNTLTKIGNSIAKNDEYESILGGRPIAIQPRSWLNYIMAFTPTEVTTDEENDIVESIIKLSARFEEKIDIDEYTHTLAPKIGIETSNEEHLKKLLVNHPTLSEDFERAISNNQGDKAENVAREILTDREYLEQVEQERDYQETIKRASSRIQELEEKVDSLGNESTSDEDKLRSEFSDIAERFSSSISEPFDESVFDEPPAKDSDINEIKNWIEMTIAMLQISNENIVTDEPFKPELENILVDVIDLSS